MALEFLTQAQLDALKALPEAPAVLNSATPTDDEIDDFAAAMFNAAAMRQNREAWNTIGKLWNDKVLNYLTQFADAADIIGFNGAGVRTDIYKYYDALIAKIASAGVNVTITQPNFADPR